MKTTYFILLLILNFMIFFQYVSAQESEKFYALKFNYEKNSEKEKLIFIQIEEQQGIIPNQNLEPTANYRLEVLSIDGGVLHSMKFSIPLKAVNVVDISEQQSYIINFTIHVPFFEEENIINIYNSNNEKLFEIPLSSGASQSELIRNIEAEEDTFNTKWAYFTGGALLITVLLTYLFLKKKNEPQQSNPALRNYVITNLRKGYTKDQIRNALAKNNYNAKEIEEAFKGIK